MANVWDIFKKLKAKMLAPDYGDYKSLEYDQQFTCTSDGFIFIGISTSTTMKTVNISVNGVSNIIMNANDYSKDSLMIPLLSGDKVIITTNSKSSLDVIRFFAVREN